MAFSFTEEQKKIINHGQGHALVSSVAGSGKSTVLQYRIRHLLERGEPPWTILTLMYNRYARDQFDEGLQKTAGDYETPSVWTFHSFGQKMLSRLCDLMEIPEPSVMTENVFWTDMLLDTISEMNEGKISRGDDPILIHHDRAMDILEKISLLKNFGHPHLPLPDAMMKDEKMKLALEIFTHFEEMRKKSQYVSLDDLLYDAFRMAYENEGLMNSYLEDFDVNYVIVDEYQDSNAIQQWLLRRIASRGAEVMVVGDDDQSIYGWRGADPLYMLKQFYDDFPGTTTYSLTQTFRYGHAVSLMANHLLQQNHVRFQKQCFSLPDSKTEVRVLTGDREDIMLRDVLSNIPMGEYSDTVVLVRNYSQLDCVELEMLRQGIPVDLDRNRMFVRRRDGLMIRDLMLWVQEREARPELDSVLTLLRFIYEKTEIDWGRDVGRMIQDLGWDEGMKTAFKKMGRNIQLSTAMARVQILLEKLSVMNSNSPAINILNTLIPFYDSVRKDMGVKQQDVYPAMKVLIDCLKGMSISQSSRWMASLEPTQGGVLLTSVHRAKGGGWKNVILPGLTEGVFPDASDSEMDEERRLFYVAITRAMSRLYLMVPEDPGFSVRENSLRVDENWKRRFANGVGDQTRVSRFMYEASPAVCIEAQRRLMNGEAVDPTWMTVHDYAKQVFPGTQDPMGDLLSGLFK